MNNMRTWICVTFCVILLVGLLASAVILFRALPRYGEQCPIKWEASR